MAENGRLRLATWNIKHGATSDGYSGDPKQVAEACAALQADVLALQEVDKGQVRSGFKDMAALAAKAAGMQVVFRRAMWLHAGQYGNALLVRGEIDDVKTIKLRGDRRHQVQIGNQVRRLWREPRNAIVATARIDDHAVSVAATHLSGIQGVKQHQLSQVLGALEARPTPQVLMGDLNMLPWMVRGYLSDDMTLPDGPPTVSMPDPIRSIDHIAVNGLTIRRVDARGFPVSDHLARIVEVDWPPAGPVIS